MPVSERVWNHGEMLLPELIQAIIDDARAGMVPEVRLNQLRASFLEDCTAHKHAAQLEAELATAWEAGRDAAADLSENWWQDGEPWVAIRALQPPGGKAK